MLWIGCMLCLLIAVAFGRSAWWYVAFKIPGLPPIDLMSGQLHIGGEWYHSQSTAIVRHSEGLDGEPDGLGGWRHARWRTGTPYPGYSWFGNWDIRLPLYLLFLTDTRPAETTYVAMATHEGSSDNDGCLRWVFDP